MKSNYRIVFCTAPDEECAEKIARALVEEKLAACCNILPNIRSIYTWKGAVCDETEWLLIIKTRVECYRELESRILSLHSYEVPEVLSIAVDQGSHKYLTWVDKHVKN